MEFYQYHYRDTIVLVKDNGLFGFAKPDGQGTALQPCAYQHVRQVAPFSNYAVQLPNSSHWGLVDSTGLLLLPCEQDDVYDGGNGWFLYKKNGFWGAARMGGYAVTPAEYDHILVDGYEDPIIFVKNGEEGRVGITGQFFTLEELDQLTDEEYDDQEFFTAA